MLASSSMYKSPPITQKAFSFKSDMPCYAMVGCVRVMSVYKGYPGMSWFDQGIPCWVVCPIIYIGLSLGASLATRRGLAAEKSPKNGSRALRAHGCFTLHAERSSMKVYMFILHTYAFLTFLFLSEVYDLFQLMCVLSCIFICFPSEVIFRSRVIGACPVTTDYILAMS